MFKSNVVLTGKLVIQKYNEQNELIYSEEFPNLVVTTGKSYLATRMHSNSADPIGYMAIGTTATTVDTTQTTLLNETARVALSNHETSGTGAAFTAVFGPGVGIGSIVEAGLFTASSSGTMLARTTFPVITKDSGETVSIYWVVSVG